MCFIQQFCEEFRAWCSLALGGATPRDLLHVRLALAVSRRSDAGGSACASRWVNDAGIFAVMAGVYLACSFSGGWSRFPAGSIKKGVTNTRITLSDVSFGPPKSTVWPSNTDVCALAVNF